MPPLILRWMFSEWTNWQQDPWQRTVANAMAPPPLPEPYSAEQMAQFNRDRPDTVNTYQLHSVNSALHSNSAPRRSYLSQAQDSASPTPGCTTLSELAKDAATASQIPLSELRLRVSRTADRHGSGMYTIHHPDFSGDLAVDLPLALTSAAELAPYREHKAVQEHLTKCLYPAIVAMRCMDEGVHAHVVELIADALSVMWLGSCAALLFMPPSLEPVSYGVYGSSPDSMSLYGTARILACFNTDTEFSCLGQPLPLTLILDGSGAVPGPLGPPGVKPMGGDRVAVTASSNSSVNSLVRHAFTANNQSLGKCASDRYDHPWSISIQPPATDAELQPHQDGAASESSGDVRIIKDVHLLDDNYTLHAAGIVPSSIVTSKS